MEYSSVEKQAILEVDTSRSWKSKKGKFKGTRMSITLSPLVRQHNILDVHFSRGIPSHEFFIDLKNTRHPESIIWRIAASFLSCHEIRICMEVCSAWCKIMKTGLKNIIHVQY